MNGTKGETANWRRHAFGNGLVPCGRNLIHELTSRCGSANAWHGVRSPDDRPRSTRRSRGSPKGRPPCERYRRQPGGTGSSGLAVTGTLKDGISVQQTILYPLRLYTHAGVSRDTLLLYDANSGYAETGYFIDGIYTPQKTYNLGSNWTHVVASCDSYLVYRRGASSAQTGLLSRVDHSRSVSTTGTSTPTGKTSRPRATRSCFRMGA